MKDTKKFAHSLEIESNFPQPDNGDYQENVSKHTIIKMNTKSLRYHCQTRIRNNTAPAPHGTY